MTEKKKLRATLFYHTQVSNKFFAGVKSVFLLEKKKPHILFLRTTDICFIVKQMKNTQNCCTADLRVPKVCLQKVSCWLRTKIHLFCQKEKNTACARICGYQKFVHKINTTLFLGKEKTHYMCTHCGCSKNKTFAKEKNPTHWKTEHFSTSQLWGKNILS